ncbi:hypothetical protein JCM10207_005007 [Rhodosporidiobolus poonsookiae]
MSTPHLVRFARFQPDDDREVAELRRQRVLCGWGEESVDSWREQVRRGVKNLYWIFPTDEAAYGPLPDEEPLSLDPTKTGPTAPDATFRPLGHVSMDWEDYAGDESLCDREKGIITLATFFILKSQQGKRLGSVVMKEMEALAAGPELNATVITLNTVDSEFAAKPEFWTRQGLPVPAADARVNESWYARLGYTVYKRGIPRYPAVDVNDGSEWKMQAVFMRKEIAPTK